MVYVVFNKKLCTVDGPALWDTLQVGKKAQKPKLSFHGRDTCVASRCV